MSQQRPDDPTDFYELAIESFRPCFSYRAAFCWFAIVMVGLVIRRDHWGLSSIVRWLELWPRGYPSLLHFFHSSAWTLEAILLHWWGWLGTNAPLLEVNRRRVFIGDHTKLAKEARKMPGVVTLHQDSETQSKPSFFRGHNWAFVAGLLSRGSAVFATPLWGKLDQGRQEYGQEVEADSSLATRIVRMAITIALDMHTPCYFVLDAFFAVGPAFLEAERVWSILLRGQLVHIVTRAKKNVVAFSEPEEPPPGRRGRKPEYGEKWRLYDLFATWADRALSAPCMVYGSPETISYLCLDLIWRPLRHKLRFVLVQTSRGQIVLMCSDLELDPLEIVRLYCLRTRIETMFFVLKHVMGGLAYHFWCKSLDKQSRRPKKNADIQAPSPEQAVQVRRTWKAIEGFVNFAAISQGLLQVIALTYPQALWRSNRLWLRTFSSEVPSEALTKMILAEGFMKHLRNFAPRLILRLIRSKQLKTGQTQELRPVERPRTCD